MSKDIIYFVCMSILHKHLNPLFVQHHFPKLYIHHPRTSLSTSMSIFVLAFWTDFAVVVLYFLFCLIMLASVSKCLTLWLALLHWHSNSALSDWTFILAGPNGLGSLDKKEREKIDLTGGFTNRKSLPQLIVSSYSAAAAFFICPAKNSSSHSLVQDFKFRRNDIHFLANWKCSLPVLRTYMLAGCGYIDPYVDSNLDTRYMTQAKMEDERNCVKLIFS